MLQIKLRASCVTRLCSNSKAHIHFKLPHLNCILRLNGIYQCIYGSGHGLSLDHTWNPEQTSFCNSALFDLQSFPGLMYHVQFGTCNGHVVTVTVCVWDSVFCWALWKTSAAITHLTPDSWGGCHSYCCAHDCVLVVGRKRVTPGRQALEGPLLCL